MMCHVKISIKSLYLNYFADKLISYVALRLVKNFNDENVSATIMGVSSKSSVDAHRRLHLQITNGDYQKVVERVVYRDAVPSFLSPVLYRLMPVKIINKIVELMFFLSVDPGDIIYLYPGCSVSLYTKLKRKGCSIVVERINTLRSNSKNLLDNEYEKLGIKPSHGITASSVSKEIRVLQLADYIFSPSPAVTESIEQVGIPSGKIISTSYGLDSEDILDVGDRKYLPKQPVTVMFVGSVCIRKGVHLLLEAWNSAGIDGKLILIGNIDPHFASTLGKYLGDAGVEHIPFVDDLKPFYQEADIFVLPSIEEGSPLVTYLALGASLPMLVSPMGAGGVVQDGKEGIVLDPHDVQEFAEALKKLADNPELREKMAKASGRTAHNYTWDKVAARRRTLLLEKLGKLDVPQGK